jgi:small-conductance mechanosensitive channel
MVEAAQKNEKIHDDPTPFALFEDFGDNALAFGFTTGHE